MQPILYSKSGCGPCVVVKKWLQANNVPYVERGPQEAMDAGYRSVPIVEYRGQVCIGFNEEKLKEMFPE